MADYTITREHSTYDNGISGNNMSLTIAADITSGLYKLAGWNGALATNANAPAGVIVGLGQYRNEGKKGEKMAVSGHGVYSIDTAVAIGTKLYASTTAGSLSDAVPGSGYEQPIAVVIRDYDDITVTDTTSTLIRLLIPVIG